MQIAPTFLEEPVYTWRDIASFIEPPPRKMVVMMLPPEEREIIHARTWTPKVQDHEEAHAYAQFAMPKFKKFLEDPRVKEMHPKLRKRLAFAWALKWATQFRAIYYKAVRREEAAVKLTVNDLGIVVGSCDAIECPVGTVVACHPEDGSRMEAFGQELAVFGAFLPEMQWEPQYCDWWESMPVAVDMQNNTVQAFGNKIVVQLEPKKAQVGMISLPDVAQRWDADAKVISVGPDQPHVQPGKRCSVDMSLVTQGGLEFDLGKEFDRQFVIPPEALNFIYKD